ncbi:MAG: hypothetical protein QNL04_01715 [SAR324 cluster bacterium]|nr:hypothetical protein [SAR324 cluster bacterium]
MDFIQHTIQWCQGEIFEGKVFTFYGATILLVSLLFWKFGVTANAKAMVIPLALVGLILVPGSFSLVTKNTQRIEQYQAAFEQDPQGFIQSEKLRTDEFIAWYPKTILIFSGLALLALGLYIFVGGPTWRAISLALILTSFTVLMLDHFSEERADKYHTEITKALEQSQ